MDELILKFLENKTDGLEDRLVKRWIEENSGNQYYFQQFTNSWREYCTADNSLLFNSLAVLH